MGRQRNRAKKRKASAQASVPPDYVTWSCSASDFAGTALLVQEVIESLKTNNDPLDLTLKVDGTLPKGRWASMAGVAHFNVGKALELMFKYLLRRNGQSYPSGYQGHQLTFLHNRLKKHVPLVTERLEATYQEIQGSKPLLLFRIIRNDVPQPASNDDQIVDDLQSLLAFLDKDARLAEKAYEGCDPERQGQWRYFLQDITPIVQVIKTVMKNHGSYIQPTEGGEQGNKAA